MTRRKWHVRQDLPVGHEWFLVEGALPCHQQKCMAGHLPHRLEFCDEELYDCTHGDYSSTHFLCC